MEHPEKKKMGMGGGMYARAKAGKGGMKNRSTYMEGGKAHSGAQPVYGNTVETSMPKAGAN